MGYKIDVIEGVGPSFAEKLATMGIKTTDDLLEKCAGAVGRKAVAAATGIGESNILKWSNHADLMRVKGIGGEYAELLEASGVDTVKELRTRNAENLAAKMAEVNRIEKRTRSVPGPLVVAKWIDQAKRLDPIITH